MQLHVIVGGEYLSISLSEFRNLGDRAHRMIVGFCILDGEKEGLP